MQEQLIKKVNGIGNAGNVIALICRILLIIAFVGTLIALIACFVMPKTLFEASVGANLQVKVDFSGIASFTEQQRAQIESALSNAASNGLSDSFDGTITGYEVTSSAVSLLLTTPSSTFGVKNLVALLVVGMVSIAAAYVVLYFVGSLCRAFRDCFSPFDFSVIREMKKFAFSLVGWAVVSLIISFVTDQFIVPNAQGSVGLNIGIVLLVLVILGLCGIFRYGAALQQEHDETL